MNSSDKIEADILRQYINPDRIEKAPDDFTINTMERIRKESLSINPDKKIKNRSLVPLIAVIFTIILISITFIFPESSSLSIPNFDFIYNIKFPVININFDSVPALNLPGWTNYFFLGIIFLILFDRALSGFFRKENKS